MPRLLPVALLLVLTPWAHATEPLKCPDGPSQIEVTKGTYSPTSGITYSLQDFAGAMVPRGSALPLCLSRITEIERGRVLVSAQTLTKLIQRARPGSKGSVSDLKVESGDTSLILSGTVRKVVPIPFRIEGPISAAGEPEKGRDSACCMSESDY